MIGGFEVRFGFVLIEGYCSIEDHNERKQTTDNLPCADNCVGAVSYYCLGNGEQPCEFFAFCKCPDMEVKTDSGGHVVAASC